MKQDSTIASNGGNGLRYGMLIPIFFLIASIISCCFSYSNTKRSIANDLNDAMLALANENSERWTCPDTIAALRQMQNTTHQPLIYQASDAKFRNTALKDEVYFTIALVDKNNALPKIKGNKIVSDSIMLVPQWSSDGLVIQVQGFVNYSMASVFNASDQTFPCMLFSLSILSMMCFCVWQRKNSIVSEIENSMEPAQVDPFAGIKLTPMQRRFIHMLLEAPGMRVDKRTLCEILWDNKSNAEESLYTLVRRTKTALAKTDIEIVCNRGDSYELHINI